ncbi:probable E3 ubiquitin-protein ligase MID2 isoform X2 [Lingula anatina]|uniref:Probable E3 ubiquitin-protein ligase MID2 isoform X2 n=1 Tax=Lingula anatina TaxID=7574 RepID=A0A1S3JJK3_LINAN|nr:probable E3 ubiquitin-protein ligase MID2 isoform X2 [Lingula anatina]|eukprot:XP_013410567.1 probable E3 ubiquitin-protein ligase MID2 isoform X2 [Lingula anatina]
MTWRVTSSMEDELTCPVCLELYADPLILPCSHSVCKQCLQDIIHSKKEKTDNEEKIDCPSCRKPLDATKEALASLPRNLALENIVIRYTEECSKRLANKASIDLPSPEPSGGSEETEDVLPADFPVEHRQKCELCEGNTPSKAAWYCGQCSVAYCHPCLDKFHPKRGSLVRHKLRRPSDLESSNKEVFCQDHEAEAAAIFCDQCQSLVCHLCVCDGVGKHAGHKILDATTASGKIKELVSGKRQGLEKQLVSHAEQQTKLEELINEIKSIHKESESHIENQYKRLLADLSIILSQERDAILHSLAEEKNQCLRKLQHTMTESKQHIKQMHMLSQSCQELVEEKNVHATLINASRVEQLNKEVEQCANKTKEVNLQFEDCVKKKSSQVSDLYTGTRKFRHRAMAAVRLMLEEDEDQCKTIIPHIKSPTSPRSPQGQGRSEAPRVHNKYLITWGFTSTSFTAEELTANSSWTVTIDKNSTHMGNLNTGYLFGVGIASVPLNFKDLTGMNEKSLGIICSGGDIIFAKNSKQECLMQLPGLPVSVSVAVRMDQPNVMVFAYKISCTHWGDVLTGKHVVTDVLMKKKTYPVFTVSQRVKLLFPTFV